VRGALMVCGTASHVGKSQVVAGLCRLLARQGVKVAPFKAQNMGLNSFVTPEGYEIGRAQAVQAMAAGVEPEVTMNPVLLKPMADGTSQVVVRGRPWRVLDASAYREAKAELRPVVLEDLADLRSRFDAVICEGAGSAAELEPPEEDLVNLGLATDVGIPVIVVGDIDRGGVFAALYGTVGLVPDRFRRAVRGFVINKFRGDPLLLAPSIEELECRTGVPTLGVLPYADGLVLDAEDGTELPRRSGPPVAASEDVLDVAVVRFPHLSNFTDVDALAVEPGVSVRFVDHPSSLGDPDLVVLPGTKATVADLAWFRVVGFDTALEDLRRDESGGVRGRSPLVLGICGGYQMLGTRIEDPGSVESASGPVDGLGLLDVRTVFLVDKRTRQRRGRTVWPRLSRALRDDGTAPEEELEGAPRQDPSIPVHGYEVHHGRVHPGPGAAPLFLLGDRRGRRTEGVVDDDGGVLGTSLHGLLEHDELRSALLAVAATRRAKHFVPSGVSFAAARQGQIEQLADVCAGHLDLEAVWSLVAEGGGATREPAVATSVVAAVGSTTSGVASADVP
jgi:adenosylcobyric acid synthase